MIKNHCFFFSLLAGVLAGSVPAAERSVAIDKTSSRIEIAVKATMDSFVGKLTDYTPTVRMDPETGKVTAATIAFLFSDVKTGNEKRDHEMHVWQQTEKFPAGTFSLTALEAETGGKLTARGTLTFHGVAQPLSFPVTVTRNGSSMTVEGDAVVDTLSFGLPVIHKFAVLKVDPLVTVHFHLVGAMAAP